MIYLSGAPHTSIVDHRSIGYIVAPHGSVPPRHLAGATHWAADNDCFARPHLFTLEGYTKWLLGLPQHRPALFATAPDVVGNAVATLERSLPTFSAIRRAGFPPAYVIQDGVDETPVPWGQFDCMFIGGSTEFKGTAVVYDLVQEAKQLGKWVHMGRVNSYRRVAYAAKIGCDSVDGTFLAFGPDVNMRKLEKWFA